MTLHFLSLASGSSGNCYYVGTEGYGLLIDAGIGLRTIRKALRNAGLDFDRLLGVLVTHDHGDHIKTVGCLGERCHLPVYTTERVHDGINRSRYVDEPLGASRRVIEKGVPFAIRDLTVEAFDIPHDSTDNVGYLITCGSQHLVIASDVGRPTDTIAHYIARAHHLILEANYDEDMLRNGSYPYYLKTRIAGPGGHLSNREAADFLAAHRAPDLRSVWLCHLSRENNRPELAYEAVSRRLIADGVRIGRGDGCLRLEVLQRNAPSDLFELD